MLRDKRINFVLALVLAVILWGYVFGQSDSTIKTTVKDIPVMLLNEDSLSERDLAISYQEFDKINITYSSKRSVTSKVNKSDFSVTGDLLGLEEGSTTLRLRINAPDDVTVSGMSAQVLRITIEKSTTHEKDVEVMIINDKSDKTEPYVVQTSLSKVQVTGAASLVDSVTKVAAKLDAKKVTEEMQAFNVELVPLDKVGNVVNGLELSSENISITAKLVNKKTVPLTIEVIGEESQRFSRKATYPHAVTIKGSDEDLKNVTEITAKPVEISDIYTTTELPIMLNLPGDTMLASDSSDISLVVTVQRASIKTLQFESLDIVANGVSAQNTVSYEGLDILLTIAGPSSEIDSVDEGDIRLSVDVSDLGLGTYSLPIVVTCDTAFDYMLLEPENVKVTIR
ncbi:MAG: hypothetical protein MJ171_07755 [Clostridia bacterium]|nr:hypothetical protein [Clostridia bacterium]